MGHIHVGRALTALTVLTVLAGVAALFGPASAAADHIGPGCLPTPLPAVPVPPVYSMDAGFSTERVHLEVWRQACQDGSDGIVLLLRITPISAGPFVCSGSFQLIQWGQQYNVKLITRFDGPSFCNDLLVPTTFALDHYSFDLHVNERLALTLVDTYSPAPVSLEIPAAPAPQPPLPPTILAPGDLSAPGPVLTTLTPTFTWSAVSGATGYGLFVRDAGSETLVYTTDAETAPLTGTAFTMPIGRLGAGLQYRWNMTSRAGSLESDASEVRYFQTHISTAPTIIILPAGCDPCRSGERLIVSVQVVNETGMAATVEVKAGIRLPDGSTFSVLADHHLEAVLPAGMNLTATILSAIVPAGIPAGTYTVEAALLEPILGTTLSRSTRTVELGP